MKLVPYWLDTAELFADAIEGPVEGRADVVVIGAGLNGLAAALTLSKKGVDIVLLDKARVGSSASGRNGGMCTTGLAIGYLTAVERYGAETAMRYYEAYCDAIDTVEQLVSDEGIACHFSRTGRLTLADKPAHFEGLAKTHAALASNGYDTTLVPPDKLRDEIGSDRYHGGVVDPRGAGLHVGKFAHGLARAGHKRGVRIHENAEVTGLRRIDGRRHEVQTAAGTILADAVLLATGSTTGPAFPYYRRRIVPVGSYIIVTEPLSEAKVNDLMPTRRMASDTRNFLYYFRITPDQRLLFGGRARFSASDPSADTASGKILERGMIEVFPELKGTRIDYCWGGLVDITMDRMPKAGERDGLFYSMGYNGHGVQMSTYMGTKMAEVIADAPEANIWRDLDWPSIPSYNGNPWFLPLVGAYYTVLDKVK